MAALLNYTMEDREGVKILNLSGNISSKNRNEFIDAVNEITAKNNVIISLRDADIVTSSGVNALVEVSAEARKNLKRVLLLGAKESFIKLIDRLDLYEQFIFVESVEQGLMKLRYFT